MSDMIPQDVPQKQCYACKKFLALTPENFPKDKRKSGGFDGKCKECTKEYKRQHYLRNKKQIAEKNKAYREEHREELVDRSKKYYSDNREQILERVKIYNSGHKNDKREYDKQYREKYKERILHQKRLYHEMHKEWCNLKSRENYKLHKDMRIEWRKKYFQSEQGKMVRRAARQRRRARKRSAEGSYTAAQLQEQLKRQKSRCYWCHNKLGKGKGAWHADHIVPLSRGGSNNISNIVIACPTCNMKKNDKLPHEWLDCGRLL